MKEAEEAAKAAQQQEARASQELQELRHRSDVRSDLWSHAGEKGWGVRGWSGQQLNEKEEEKKAVL